MKIVVEIPDLVVQEYDEAIERHKLTPLGLEVAVRRAVEAELRSEITPVFSSSIGVRRSDRTSRHGQ